MGTHERLVAILTPALRSIRPDSEMAGVRALQVAIRPDGRIDPAAIADVLPWQPRDFWVSGTASVASNVAQMFRVRQHSRLVYLDARAKTAPSGGEWQGVVGITGGGVGENVSIVAGETSGSSVANLSIPAGSLLQLDVVAANSAANVTVTAWLVPVA